MEAKNKNATKRPKRIGITWKMFAILFAFVSVFALIIWLLQIQMLNYFYQTAKFKELDNSAKAISEVLGDDTRIIQVADQCAEEYYSDIWVYSLESNSFDHNRRIVYSDGTRDSFGFFLEPKFDALFTSAQKNGGTYIAMVPMRNFKDRYFEFKIIDDNSDKSSEYPYVSSNVRKLNVFHTTLLNHSGEKYVIIQRANITPLGTMVKMLENQVIFIGVALVVLSLVMAAIMSRVIIKPIENINKSARKLALGKYDTEFKGHGYREIDELSDTLNFAATELSKNDRLQKEIISNVSHDLRTPLTMIKGYSEVMRDIPGENKPENVQVIIDETTRLTDLVNDMLDLSRLQVGARIPDMQVFSLTDMLEDILGRYEKLTKQNEYKINLIAEKNVSVVADATMVLQVIYNLINNAINYTGDDKTITVRQDIVNDVVRITVSDSGEGIPEEDIPHIWDRYYKVDKVHKRAAVGTGLGLAIVKEALELHNATYGVTSTKDKGTSFWFELKTADSDEYRVEVVDL